MMQNNLWFELGKELVLPPNYGASELNTWRVVKHNRTAGEITLKLITPREWDIYIGLDGEIYPYHQAMQTNQIMQIVRVREIL